MRGPFYRACRKHKETLEDRTESTKGHEILWCAIGEHRCSSWLVLDDNGETIAIGYINEAPQLVSLDMANIDCPPPQPPDKFCQRGHYEWALESDGKYRCRICRRDRLIAHNTGKYPTLITRPRLSEKRHRGFAERAKIASGLKKLNSKLRRTQRCQKPTR